MKFELNRLIEYSDESLLSEVRRVAELINEKPLLIEKFNKVSKVHASTIIRRFGSWQTAILKSGLDSEFASRAKSYFTKDEIINDIKRVSSLLNKQSFSQEEFFQYGICKHRGIRKNFGSFQDAMKEAGLKPLALGTHYSKKECFENLLKLWTYYGRQPHYSEIKKNPSTVGPKAYITKWQTWRKALLAFIEFIQEDQEVQEQAIIEEIKNIPSENLGCIHKTKRAVSDRLRVLVLIKDGNKCKICGVTVTGENIHIDHIKPWIKGGETVLDNLQVLCSKCNLGKGDIEISINSP